MNNNRNMGSRQNKRPAPLKTAKSEEVRQYRPPVIIHTYSPKINYVDAANFSSFVQNLTGRGQKRKPEASPRVPEFTVDDFLCASPSSSADSGIAGVLDRPNGLVSPRGPLASYEHLYQQGFGSSSAPSQAATDQVTTAFTNAVFAAAAATAASEGPQYSPLFSNSLPSSLASFSHLFSPLPSPNLLSSSFMADLPVLSPRHIQDAFGSHGVLPSPGYSRFSVAGMLPSPGSNNAFKDMATLMMSRN